MTGRLRPAAKTAKLRRFPQGNQSIPQGNPISVVMQKVRGSLGDSKPAQTLRFLTDQPLSICQKTLSGHRAPNAAMYEALFRSPLIVEAILGLTEGATDPKVRAVRKAVKRIKLEDEIARLEAGEGE
jgi:hypothetical protein